MFKATAFPFRAIIDKTGSIILYKKAGELGEKEWENTLVRFKKGDRKGLLAHTAFFPRGRCLDFQLLLLPDLPAQGHEGGQGG